MGHEWQEHELATLSRMRSEGATFAEIGRAVNRSEASVRSRFRAMRIETPAAPATRLPAPAPEAGGPSLPAPCNVEYTSFSVDQAGWWGVISDIHIPYHDLRTIEKWVEECRQKNVAGLILNGDVLDFYQLSDFLRDPSMPRTKDEILKGRQLLEYLRSRFPKIPIVFKKGNHDERLEKYLFGRCPDLSEIEDFQLHSLLRAKEFGVDWVEDKRVVMLGKLPVIHGHEYRGGGGVMPARWLYLRTGASAVCGHFHQPSNYTFRTIEGREVGMWSTGCACYLSPAYMPLNQWSNGYAMVEISQGGGYSVHNRRLLKNGSVA